MTTIWRALVVALTLACSVTRLAAHEQPRLVVVISLDQFPQEYVERFGPYFAKGGFGRFIHGGAVFTNAWLPYASTYTAPGHASIGSGRPPRDSGIVANTWFNRLRDRDQYCVEDFRTQPSAGQSDGASPVNMREDSLGDRFRARYPRGKVIGLSYKDRAAIPMTGHRANAAYWFDDALPAFVSSDYYDYNPEVLRFNKKVKPFIAAHPAWTQTSHIPPAALEKITFDPPSLRKFKDGEFGFEFPHPITNGESFKYTPLSNDLLLDFAGHIIDVERLGQDSAPDLLFIGISSPDYLGHHYGPESLEVADAVVRVDRSLERFLDRLIARFGEGMLVALTADHGVQSIPEVALAMGKDAGRLNFIALNKAKTIGEFSTHRRMIELAAARRLGLETTEASPRSASLIRSFEEPALYFNWERIRELGLDGELVKKVFKEEALKIHGVAAAFTNSELLRTNPRASGLEQAARMSFHPDRSGDLVMILRENYIFSSYISGTTHGQPVERDQRIPLMLWGAAVKKGTYSEKVSPLRLPTTIGALFGVTVGEEGATPLPCLKR